MVSFKRVILFLLLSLLCFELAAQRKYSAKGQDYTCVVMQKKNYIGGVGLRMGDAMGGTLKFYFLKRFAAEFIVGHARGGINGKFHERTFRESFSETDISYAGHEVLYSYGFHSRLMMHNLIPRGFSGLDWYFGFGAQMRMVNGKYDYFSRTVEPKLERKKIKTINFGPEAILGVDFAFPRSPFSSFGELGIFVNINDSHQFLLPQGGLGLRYNF
ncbi:MAG: hypothetical protein M3421_01895 [Bacteroidota bacterium]|nr:hypothetical protein [Bacteroidota bacterium]